MANVIVFNPSLLSSHHLRCDISPHLLHPTRVTAHDSFLSSVKELNDESYEIQAIITLDETYSCCRDLTRILFLSASDLLLSFS